MTRSSPLDDHPDLARIRSRARSRAADLVATVLDPLLICAALITAVAVHASRSVLHGLGWAALAVLFTAVLPATVLFALVRSGRVLDRHVAVREQRYVLLAPAAGSIAVGLLLLWLLGAPRDVVALAAALLTGALVLAVVTFAMKASVHVAVASGAAAVVGVVFGGMTLWGTVPAIAAISWARWRAGRHTGLQVLVGLLLGAASTGLAFVGLR